jgi:hypothetical protein
VQVGVIKKQFHIIGAIGAQRKMILFGVALMVDPVAIPLFYLVNAAVPLKAQRPQFTIFKMADDFDVFKNIFKFQGVLS